MGLDAFGCTYDVSQKKYGTVGSMKSYEVLKYYVGICRYVCTCATSHYGSHVRVRYVVVLKIEEDQDTIHNMYLPTLTYIRYLPKIF